MIPDKMYSALWAAEALEVKLFSSKKASVVALMLVCFKWLEAMEKVICHVRAIVCIMPKKHLYQGFKNLLLIHWKTKEVPFTKMWLGDLASILH